MRRTIGLIVVAAALAAGAAVASGLSYGAAQQRRPHQVATLTPVGGSAQTTYGPVAVSGGTMAVGGQDQDREAVHVFTAFGRAAGGWHEAAKLIPSDGAVGDLFGNAVAVSPNTIAVGARSGDGAGGAGSGAVYVFTKPPGGWSGTLRETAKLVASVGSERPFGSAFGSSVAISGATIFAGAPSADVGRRHSQGLVFAFNEPAHGWSGVRHQSALLLASNGIAYENFGQVRALAASGEDVFVGEDGSTPHGGVVYVFHRPAHGWRGTVRQTASLGGTRSSRFISVAAAGRAVVTGTYTPDASAGAAYIYARPRRGWPKLAHPSAHFDFAIGGYDQAPSVAISSGRVAAIDDQVGLGHNCPCSGRVFVLHEPRGGWTHHAFPPLQPSISLPTGGSPNEVALDAQNVFAAGTGAVRVYSLSGS